MMNNPPAGTPAPTQTFTEYYNNAAYDEYTRQYANIMATFRTPGGLLPPAQLRELVSNNPRESSTGYAALCLPAGNPAHQGTIYAIHSVAKFSARLGQPATQWDGLLFCSINDVVGNQIPTTVAFPLDGFSRQNGGAHFRVGLPELMDAMFNVNPALELLPAFGNFDAGTELIELRNMVHVPHRYMRHQIRQLASSQPYTVRSTCRYPREPPSLA
jgi:hypothetical protein